MLCSLNAYFCLEAINLSPSVIANIAKSTKKNPTFELFLDTNFLLYLIGLRDDEYHAALTLIDLVRQLHGRVQIRLQVLPITIDETKRVISAAQASLSGLQVNRHLADAARRAGLDAIAAKFIAEAAQRPLAAETYFGPYLRDLLEVIRSHGAEFHNTRLDPYRTDQRVVDDILAQQQYEEKHHADKAKGYEQLEHDVTLWHFVNRRRPATIESPLEAHSWIMTLDRRLLAFDASKRKRNDQRVPVCVHPATVMHMLQFFVPRTTAFEDAILGSMGLPFFHGFTSNDERVTLRILHTLGRFQDANNLPPTAATSILFNDALRQKLTPDLVPEQEHALIKEALVQELHERNRELDALHASHSALERTRLADEQLIASKDDELNQLRTTSTAQAQEIERLNTCLMAAAQERSAERDGQTQHAKNLESRIASLEEGHRTNEATSARHAFIRNHSLAAILVAVAAAAVVRAAHWRLPQLPNTQLAAVVALIVLMTWCFLFDRMGVHHPAVASWRVFQAFHRWKRTAIGLGGALVLSITANALYDAIKHLWNTNHITGL